MGSEINSDLPVSMINFSAPPFWPEKVTLWFSILEIQFQLNGICSDQRKFGHVVSLLGARHMVEVEDIITNPPEEGKYQKLKEELIRRLSITHEQRIRRLLEHEEMGDRTPSQFLHHLRSIAGPTTPDIYLRSIWVRRLPWNLQHIVHDQDAIDLNALANVADKVLQELPRCGVATTEPNPEVSSLREQVEALMQELTSLRARLDQGRSRDTSNEPRTRQRSRSPRLTRPPQLFDGLCWYHWKFGAAAYKCYKACRYNADEQDDGVSR